MTDLGRKEADGTFEKEAGARAESQLYIATDGILQALRAYFGSTFESFVTVDSHDVKLKRTDGYPNGIPGALASFINFPQVGKGPTTWYYHKAYVRVCDRNWGRPVDLQLDNTHQLEVFLREYYPLTEEVERVRRLAQEAREQKFRDEESVRRIIYEELNSELTSRIRNIYTRAAGINVSVEGLIRGFLLNIDIRNVQGQRLASKFTVPSTMARILDAL
jgi:hypothetical protein